MHDARLDVDRVLAELGELVGTPLQLDAQGMAVLEFADDVICTIAVPDHAARIAVELSVARLPREGRDAILVAALRRNRFELEVAGAWIALDEAGEELLLCCSIPATRDEIDRLPDTLAALVEQAGELRGLLHGATPRDSEGADVSGLYSSTMLFRG